MAPRITVTGAHSRPTDPSFTHFVKHYDPKRTGVWCFWTDSAEEAGRFASTKNCYGKRAIVQERAEWALGRRLGLTEKLSPDHGVAR